MSDYTPTTEVVKHAVTFPRERLGEPRPIKPEAFDRWLDHVKAKAWEEGFADGVNHDIGDWENAPSIITNPYRQEQDQ